MSICCRASRIDVFACSDVMGPASRPKEACRSACGGSWNEQVGGVKTIPRELVGMRSVTHKVMCILTFLGIVLWLPHATQWCVDPPSDHTPPPITPPYLWWSARDTVVFCVPPSTIVILRAPANTARHAQVLATTDGAFSWASAGGGGGGSRKPPPPPSYGTKRHQPTATHTTSGRTSV